MILKSHRRTGPCCAAVLLVALLIAPSGRPDDEAAPTPLHRIAFGSCANQKAPQPMWDNILERRPDLFIFAGDNIYADTENMDEMRADYARLAAMPGFARLRKTCPVLATWDDHDYGANDAGAEYPRKKESQQVFRDFFGAPADPAARSRPGVYDARIFGPPGRQVQIILLDTRYFRGPLVKNPSPQKDRGPYAPGRDASVTLLGRAQWKWLEEQLNVPAEIRLIVSSIQVVAEEHDWEKWMNLPHERARLFHLIGETGAGGIIFLSGDRHQGELSMMKDAVGYPLYDLTSSGLNQRRHRIAEPNRHRRGRICWEQNFGLVEIHWEKKPGHAAIALQLVTGEGKTALRRVLRLSDLQP